MSDIKTLTKDSYTEIAGGLIIREAGGSFMNIDGDSNVGPDDRHFIGGTKTAVE